MVPKREKLVLSNWFDGVMYLVTVLSNWFDGVMYLGTQCCDWLLNRIYVRQLRKDHQSSSEDNIDRQDKQGDTI